MNWVPVFAWLAAPMVAFLLWVAWQRTWARLAAQGTNR